MNGGDYDKQTEKDTHTHTKPIIHLDTVNCTHGPRLHTRPDDCEAALITNTNDDVVAALATKHANTNTTRTHTHAREQRHANAQTANTHTVNMHTNLYNLHE